MTGAITGSSREKVYQELGFELLPQRRWYRKLSLIFKVIKNQSRKYLFELIPTARQAYMTRHENSVPLFHVKHSFFPSTALNPLFTGLFQNRCLLGESPLDPNIFLLLVTYLLIVFNCNFHEDIVT